MKDQQMVFVVMKHPRGQFQTQLPRLALVFVTNEPVSVGSVNFRA